MIDKQSEHWKAQPLWFRTWAWGSRSRKADVWFELSFLVFAVVISIISYFDPSKTSFALIVMYFLYIHTVYMRYGDKHRSWGGTT